jgi:hypothetical protein
MLLLELTTDKLSIITSSAATIDVHVSYSINTAGVITFAKQNTAISSATTTDVLGVPSASTVRNMNLINIRNKDASLACDVTVQYNANGTLYELFKTTLQPGGVLTSAEGVHWFPYQAVPSLDMTKYVTADSVHATAATFADITGLTFPVIAGRNYAYHAWLIAITNATTTGAQFGIGGVAMTYMDLAGVSPLLAGTGATAGTYTQGRATAINTAFAVQTTGEVTNQLHWMAGGFTPSASGTFAIRATSEVSVAAGLTVRKGSWARVTQTAN